MGESYRTPPVIREAFFFARSHPLGRTPGPDIRLPACEGLCTQTRDRTVLQQIDNGKLEASPRETQSRSAVIGEVAGDLRSRPAVISVSLARPTYALAASSSRARPARSMPVQA